MGTFSCRTFPSMLCLLNHLCMCHSCCWYSDYEQGCWEWHWDCAQLSWAMEQCSAQLWGQDFLFCSCACDLWLDLLFYGFGSVIMRAEQWREGSAWHWHRAGAGSRCRRAESGSGVTSQCSGALRCSSAPSAHVCVCKARMQMGNCISFSDPSWFLTGLLCAHFWKRRVNFAEGSHSTLTVSTSAEAPANLQPYLLHNKFPGETQAQVHWSIEAEKKLETSRTHRHPSTDYS